MDARDLIRAQIRQVLLEARVQHLDVGTADRLEAAVERIATAWTADVEQAYEDGANAYGPGPAFPETGGDQRTYGAG